MSYLKVGGAGKRYGDSTVLHHVTFAVERGEFVSILGPSGSGKTTLLRILAGLTHLTSGYIECGGQTLASAERRIHVQPERRNQGIVFQDYALWPHLSVYQHVALVLPMQTRKTAKNKVQQIVCGILDAVHLGHLLDAKPSRLSGGQQQRLAVARAIAADPKLLLLDEPFSALDMALRDEMRNELIPLLRKRGFTVIHVTHDQDEALALSDKVLVLRDGGVEQFSTPEELYQNPATAFVASFVGGRVPIRVERVAGEKDLFEVPDMVDKPRIQAPLPMQNHGCEAGMISTFHVYASGLHVHLGQPMEPESSVQRSWRFRSRAMVKHVRFLGGAWEADLQFGDKVTLKHRLSTRINVGMTVHVYMDFTQAPWFPVDHDVAQVTPQNMIR